MYKADIMALQEIQVRATALMTTSQPSTLNLRTCEEVEGEQAEAEEEARLNPRREEERDAIKHCRGILSPPPLTTPTKALLLYTMKGTPLTTQQDLTTTQH